MCGIFALLNYEQKYSKDFIQTQFEKGRARGPDHSTFQKVGCKIAFGFHRLAINGLNAESNQPLKKGDITLICNGEIYNYKELYALMGADPTTESDCEVILWLYEKYGIEQTLQMLDGVFAFALLDQRTNIGEPVFYVARDPYGVRPLYHLRRVLTKIKDLKERKESTVGFASELKSLSNFASDYQDHAIHQFPPGTYSKYVFSDNVCSEWSPIVKNAVYHRQAFSNAYASTPIDAICKGIRYYLTKAVEKRCSTTDRPIACLLSGGLDSSLIAALVNRYHVDRGLPTIETYSIGLAESTDLMYARIVADYLGTKHTEVVLTEREFCEAIPEVIQAIESYDTTTVRASIGNYLLGKYIAANSEAKVIFNGDGSDELLGGYLYMKSAPDAIEFDKECRRLLTDIHAFDVLRSDKSISSHGLEPRTPFLDREWTQIYLSISPAIRFRPDRIEKYLLRQAFSSESEGLSKALFFGENTSFSSLGSDGPLALQLGADRALLPDEVLWRRKEAFSDGVSGQNRSLYQILQEYCQSKIDETGYFSNELQKKQFTINQPKTAEQLYYRRIFEEYYPGMESIVPYFWMPKYVEATDASARTLSTYRVGAQVFLERSTQEIV